MLWSGSFIPPRVRCFELPLETISFFSFSFSLASIGYHRKNEVLKLLKAGVLKNKYPLALLQTSEYIRKATLLLKS
jgi:hypothetical protein